MIKRYPIFIIMIALSFSLSLILSPTLFGKTKKEVPPPAEFKIVEAGDKSAPGVTLAAANLNAVWDKAKNLEKMKKVIKIAAKKGVDLLVFPEQFLQGYVYMARPSFTIEHELFQYQMENAETIPGPSTDAIAELAAKYNMYIAFGMTEKAGKYGGGKAVMFNSNALVGPQGVIGIYRKVHQPGSEYHLYVKGSAFNVYDTAVGKVGMSICYDKAFPEVARTYAIKGADIILHTTAWPMSGALTVNGVTEKEYAGYMCGMFDKVRAAENQVWYVASDNVGKDAKAGWVFWGHSRIINPSGIVIAEIGQEEGLVIAHGLDINGEILKARTQYFFGLDLLFDRAPWMYKEVASEEAMYPPYIPGKPVEVKVRKPYREKPKK